MSEETRTWTKIVGPYEMFPTGPAKSTAGFFGVRMACLRFEAGSLLPFSGGAQAAGQAQLNPTAGQAPLPKAEASRPHSKVDAAAGQQKIATSASWPHCLSRFLIQCSSSANGNSGTG